MNSPYKFILRRYLRHALVVLDEEIEIEKACSLCQKNCRVAALEAHIRKIEEGQMY